MAAIAKTWRLVLGEARGGADRAAACGRRDRLAHVDWRSQLGGGGGIIATLCIIIALCLHEGKQSREQRGLEAVGWEAALREGRPQLSTREGLNAR